MCERGTEVAMYDYADFAERILGVSAWIIFNASAPNHYEGDAAHRSDRIPPPTHTVLHELPSSYGNFLIWHTARIPPPTRPTTQRVIGLLLAGAECSRPCTMPQGAPYHDRLR